MSFKDYFSDGASAYRAFRPRYPAALFEYLAGLAPARSLAWDCATGNGQSATALASHFERVVATDASATQIGNAEPANGVEYRVEPAETSSLETASVDLITVSQALHWFERERFEDEVARVARQEGVLAVWSYALFRSTPALDATVAELYDGILGKDWTDERRIVERGYADIDFRFDELEVPSFAMQADWDFDQLTGYLSTWSAAKRYEARTGDRALDAVIDALGDAWGEPRKKHRIEWPLTVRAWRAP